MSKDPTYFFLFGVKFIYDTVVHFPSTFSKSRWPNDLWITINSCYLSYFSSRAAPSFVYGVEIPKGSLRYNPERIFVKDVLNFGSGIDIFTICAPPRQSYPHIYEYFFSRTVNVRAKLKWPVFFKLSSIFLHPCGDTKSVRGRMKKRGRALQFCTCLNKLQ